MKKTCFDSQITQLLPILCSTYITYLFGHVPATQVSWPRDKDDVNGDETFITKIQKMHINVMRCDDHLLIHSSLG